MMNNGLLILLAIPVGLLWGAVIAQCFALAGDYMHEFRKLRK